MTGFDKIHFKGSFRSYQSRVLDHADGYLCDGKINIVAAPGSGKTVLGLELIRRLGESCLILSPTTAIRRQWGDRFRELFCDSEEDFTALFSNDLHRVKTINSVTYQALYTAVEKTPESDDGDIDSSDVAIFSVMREYNIKTVCLDEAHHLKNEWQKALEKFIAALDEDVKIISLTATPPYDSEGTEWSRYQAICGEIDEEIFVPELVGQNTLCPHQDYVFFNYPTKAETESYFRHAERAAQALEALKGSAIFSQLHRRLGEEKNNELFYCHIKEFTALFVLLRYFGYETDKKLIRALTLQKGLPLFRMTYAETALQFLLDGELTDDVQKQEILDVLKANAVYEKKKVTLTLSERLKRAMISSVGKLQSIKRIVRSEADAMGERLRMLILTDYIKKEETALIQTGQAFDAVHVVSIFETLRRTDPTLKIGVLSGTLVILPDSVDLSGVVYKAKEIPNTGYLEVQFTGGTQNAVSFVGKLFEQGKLQILVGTKSLLGEGWDSPCINSLILASFVGSFVLSNQMRGRAIRVDKNDPGKTANIWHLVTVEPEHLFRETASEQLVAYLKRDEKELLSYDYETLRRRFESFMGPNETTGTIESGIGRLTLIKPPYTEAGIEKINTGMLSLAADRERVKAMWDGEVKAEGFAVCVETQIPGERKVPVFTFLNFALDAVICAVGAAFLIPLWMSVERIDSVTSLLALLASAVFCVILYQRTVKMLRHINPAHSMKTLGEAVYKTLCACSLIAPYAKVGTDIDKERFLVSLYLYNASTHDRNIFNTAMTELLSPIENPRYLLIAKTGEQKLRPELSFACPSVIGKKKEYVAELARQLKQTTGNFEPFYTYCEQGRKMLLSCRSRSYITKSDKAMKRKLRYMRGS